MSEGLYSIWVVFVLNIKFGALVVSFLYLQHQIKVVMIQSVRPLTMRTESIQHKVLFIFIIFINIIIVMAGGSSLKSDFLLVLSHFSNSLFEEHPGITRQTVKNCHICSHMYPLICSMQTLSEKLISH